MKIDSIRTTGLALAVALGVSLIAGPALAQPSYAVRHATIHGRIASFDGKYGLTIRDDRGYVDRVRMRDGTIINPTGLRLVAGMQVTIMGEPAGNTFVAFEIDTPYSVRPEYGSGYAPGYAYAPGYGYAPGYAYAPGYTYPYPPPYYPAYPYPAYYPYPYYSVGLGFDFSFGGRRGHRRW